MNPIKQIKVQLYGGPLDGEDLEVCGAATSISRRDDTGTVHIYAWSLRRVRGRRIFKYHSTCNSAHHA